MFEWNLYTYMTFKTAQKQCVKSLHAKVLLTACQHPINALHF